MLYPRELERKLGFDRIREILKEECKGSPGKEMVDKLRFSSDYEEINRYTEQSDEFLRILSEKISFPESNFFDVSSFLKKAEILNNFLDTEEFHKIKLSLNTLYLCLQFFYKRREEFPTMWLLCEDTAVPLDLLEAIEKVVDDKGKMRNNASFELMQIRADLQKTEMFLRKKLDQIQRHLSKKEWINEEAEITIREGRMVLPVKAEHKRHVQGIVHDTSATGQTVFIEPSEVLGINNEIKELIHREKREIIRILVELTDTLRPYLESLQKAYGVLAEIDFIRAKARFAQKIDARKPLFIKKCRLNWKAAHHPLLLLAYAEQGRKVIPYDIRLDEYHRILLISGPNAGGKSVCLKTVGLLQYMFQCGLLVPVEEGSEIGLFNDMFLDIGDEQSIENDLSTYSSHLHNMKKFVSFAGKHSLCLIDEFGTGTEPQFGAAIAESILEELNTKKVFAVITTHYANLKFMAENTTGIVNGAMRFDMTALEPLYELEIGKPGSSFALEIAKKIGLRREILDKAREKVGVSQVDVERVLQDLETEKTSLRRRNAYLEGKQQELEKKVDQYDRLREKMHADRKQIMDDAKLQAKQLLDDANRRIEQTIREIKEKQAEKERTKELRKDLDRYGDSIKVKKKKEETSEKHKFAEGEIRAGDFVLIEGQDTVAEVIEVRGKDAHVRIGQLKSNIKLKRLRRLDKKDQKDPQFSGKVHNINMTKKRMDFSPELDIRGARAEDALLKINEFMDTAVMLGQPSVRIIHGKGNGVLRDVVRSTVLNFKEVRKVSDEHADRGGNGVTVVRMG